MKKPQELEASVESAITSVLQCHGWLVIPLNAERPNGGKPQKRQAKAGTPDLAAFKNGRGILIECKRPKGGKVLASQKLFRPYAEKHGVPYVLALSVDDIWALTFMR